MKTRPGASQQTPYSNPLKAWAAVTTGSFAASRKFDAPTHSAQYQLPLFPEGSFPNRFVADRGAELLTTFSDESGWVHEIDETPSNLHFVKARDAGKARRQLAAIRSENRMRNRDLEKCARTIHAEVLRGGQQ